MFAGRTDISESIPRSTALKAWKTRNGKLTFLRRNQMKVAAVIVHPQVARNILIDMTSGWSGFAVGQTDRTRYPAPAAWTQVSNAPSRSEMAHADTGVNGQESLSRRQKRAAETRIGSRRRSARGILCFGAGSQHDRREGPINEFNEIKGLNGSQRRRWGSILDQHSQPRRTSGRLK